MAREERNRTDGPARARGRRTRSCPATRPTSTSRAPRAILAQEGLDPLVTMEVFTRQDARAVRHRRGEEPARPRPRRRRPGRDPARGARRRRPDRAQGGRPADPRALPPVRAVRDGDPRDARPVDRLGDRRPRVRRGRRARAGHQLRRPPRPPGHHRRPRLRRDRRRLRRRLDAGRRPAGRPRADRHDAALAGADLRRHGRGGPGVRSARRAGRAPDRPRRHVQGRGRGGAARRRTPSATGCTASGSTRRRSAAG